VTVQAGSKVGGRVAERLVEEGDCVSKGDVLVRLESAEADAAVAAAQAQLAQAEAMLQKIETGARPEQIRQAKAAVDQAEQQYQMAKRGFRSQEIQAARAAEEAAQAQRDQAAADFARVESLSKEGVVSQQLFDQAKHALEAAEAQLQGAREQSNLVETGSREEQIAMAKAAFDRATAAFEEIENGAREEDIAAARAIRDAAAADLELARSTLREMTILAPRDGVVESIDIHEGDLVKPGAIVRIADPEDLELMVYVSAAALGHLQLGQTVPFTTDSHGAEVFEGTISFIASQGEYTPRNLQTQEERIQQMFGVKVELNSAAGKLKAGMSATVHLDLDNGVA
jgi:HlyD family secretion protein